MKLKKSYNKQNKYHWKGGRFTDCRGYIFILIGDKYVAEHRLVMENQLGRRLEFSEKIHHINGDKSDNRIENLKLCSQSEHCKIEGFGKNLKGKKRTKQHNKNWKKSRWEDGKWKKH